MSALRQILVAYGNVDSTYAAPKLAVEYDETGIVAPWLQPAMIHDAYPSDNAAEANTLGTSALNIRSPQGQAFRNAILHRNAGRDLWGAGTPQLVGRSRAGIDAAGEVVREMTPLWKPPSGPASKPGYRDLFGAFAARAAFTIPIIAALRYQGQLPLDQQPVLHKPPPWADPTRGRA